MSKSDTNAKEIKADIKIDIPGLEEIAAGAKNIAEGTSKVRIPVKSATHSKRRLPPGPGKAATLSERSDAGVLFYFLSSVFVNCVLRFLNDSPFKFNL